jgi:membrane protein YqaA with SNARE-associated domain
MTTFGYLSLAFYGFAKTPESITAFKGWLNTKVESK